MPDQSSHLLDRHAPEIVDTTINRIIELRSVGISEPLIMQDVFIDWSDEDAHVVWDMALARIHDLKEPRIHFPLFMTQADLRFATHRFIAEHRAKRLACDTIVDVGCGIGSQTIALAKTCKTVIAIDHDPLKISFCQANCAKLGLSNVKFMCADGPDALESLNDIDAVFCDPERAPSEEKRSFNTLNPPIIELVDVLTHKTQNLVIELPPQMKDIPLNGELEYASIDGKLARLTLYRGSLSVGNKSVVRLPFGEQIRDTDPVYSHPEKTKPQKFIFELDHAIPAAGLMQNVPGEFNLLPGHYPLLGTSSKDMPSPWFKSRFTILGVAQKKDQLKDALRRYNASKAIIRYPIKSEEYWIERTPLEKGLTGDKVVHLFFLGSAYVLAQKLKVNTIP